MATAVNTTRRLLVALALRPTDAVPAGLPGCSEGSSQPLPSRLRGELQLCEGFLGETCCRLHFGMLVWHTLSIICESQINGPRSVDDGTDEIFGGVLGAPRLAIASRSPS